MRLSLVFVLIALSPAAAHADDEPADIDVVWKALEGKVLSEKQLVPRGFVKNGEGAKGDLDGDRLEDIVLIIHRDHRKLVRAPGEDVLAQLILIFTAVEPGKYSAWLAGYYADWDLDASDDDNEGQPLQIKKGVLTIGWASPEGPMTGQNCTMKWRNGPAGFQLIGLTVNDFDKRCACGSSSDTNYLTGVEIYETDQGKDGDQLKKPRTKKIRAKPQTILWEKLDWDKMCSSGE